MKAELIKSEFEEGWFDKLKPYIETDEFDNIFRVLKQETDRGIKVYPESKYLFRAFRDTPYNDLRVVMIGQDPYPQPGIADGLAFSCGLTNKSQPSLIEIHREIDRTIYKGINTSSNKDDTDLTYLAKQGVLLINTALTVREFKPGSHTELWRGFIENLINTLNTYNSGLVFVLVGSVAQNLYYDKIAPFTHERLICEHPAACAYRGDKWNSNNIFVDINIHLKQKNNTIINW